MKRFKKMPFNEFRNTFPAPWRPVLVLIFTLTMSVEWPICLEAEAAESVVVLVFVVLVEPDVV